MQITSDPGNAAYQHMVGIAGGPSSDGHEVDDLGNTFIRREVRDQNVGLGEVVLSRAHIVIGRAQ